MRRTRGRTGSGGGSPRPGWAGWSAGWSGSAAPGPAAPTATPGGGDRGGLAGRGRRGAAAGAGRDPEGGLTWPPTTESAPPRRWVSARRANRQALARFAEFWQALQDVGDALAEAQTAAKNAESGDWRERNQRHWTIASVDEVRSALRAAASSLRIVSAQAKRFEPQLIEKDWRR